MSQFPSRVAKRRACDSSFRAEQSVLPCLEVSSVFSACSGLSLVRVPDGGGLRHPVPVAARLGRYWTVPSGGLRVGWICQFLPSLPSPG